MQNHDFDDSRLKRAFLALTEAEQRDALATIQRILASLHVGQYERARLFGVTTFDPDAAITRN